MNKVESMEQRAKSCESVGNRPASARPAFRKEKIYSKEKIDNLK